MKHKAKKFDNVEIQFMDMDAADTVEATVLLRGDEMVIDMQDSNGVTDYLIVGKPADYYYAGVNTAGKAMPKVNARWVKLGKIYVGVWVEEGWEYLFSFKLVQ